jgi:hypothetical protein
LREAAFVDGVKDQGVKQHFSWAQESLNEVLKQPLKLEAAGPPERL